MKILILLLLSLRLATNAVASQRALHNSWVESVVSSATQEFSPCVTFKGHPHPHHPGSPDTPAPTTSTSTPKPTQTSTDTTEGYWLADIHHQGVAAFNSNPGYKVFRNVKDYGARGDGLHDDTAAINFAISQGGRCGPGVCKSSTTTPATVYFPAGTYLLSGSIIDFYFTQLIGNPNNMPVLKPMGNFAGFGLIDGNQYQAGGSLGWGATNTFFRQIRNFKFDMRDLPPDNAITGIHWPTAQATSIQNCIFWMSDAPGTQHQGIFIEDGSGGFVNDLVFYGGKIGANFGNQQFTMRNLTFHNAVTAINQIWNWGWTYKGVSINNCSTGIDMTNTGGGGKLEVGSVILLDSDITDTKIGIVTSRDATSQPPTAGSLILENVKLSNVGTTILGTNNRTVLAGTSGETTIYAWGAGNYYAPTGPTVIENRFPPFPRAPSLINSGSARFYSRSKPQYETLPVSSFLSVRDAGAVGDGIHDDTSALNKVLKRAAWQKKIVFFDAGTYKVTSTINVPAGSKIVGEAYPVIMGSGQYFSNIHNPRVVVRTGGGTRTIEWSDMIVSTQGPTAGAILIQWNTDFDHLYVDNKPSGMWDVHVRIAGFSGSNLQVKDCPTSTDPVSKPDPKCIAAFMGIHISRDGAGLYMENVWIWTADHDIDDPDLKRITVYTGRGFLDESKFGSLWLYGTAVEHFALYQYQFLNTANVVMGQIQTETAYYQPNPPATVPFRPLTFTYVAGSRITLSDPDFSKYCAHRNGTCASGWGLRVLKSSDILVYGAGLYSFFSNYNTSCSDAGAGSTCQTQIFGIDTGGTYSPGTAPQTSQSSVYVYNLNTIGVTSMVEKDGVSLARFSDNVNVYPDTVAVFRSLSGSS